MAVFIRRRIKKLMLCSRFLPFTKILSAKYISSFITVEALCKTICRVVAVERPSVERFIAAAGRKEHLGRGYIGRGLSGIGRKSKHGDQK